MGHRVDDAAAALTGLLTSGSRPDAVFCHDDALAIGALLAVRAAEIAVSDDIAVLGFDDGDPAVRASASARRSAYQMAVHWAPASEWWTTLVTSCLARERTHKATSKASSGRSVVFGSRCASPRCGVSGRQ